MRRSSRDLVEPGLKPLAIAVGRTGAWSRRAALRASASTAVLALLMGAAQAVPLNTVVEGAPVTVPGTHSSPWTIPNDLLVGDSQDGTLIIQSGGQVNGTTALVGSDNVTGAVTVQDANSAWTNTGSISIGVGSVGIGFLNILNGGAVSNTVGQIGATVGGATGTVTVSGSGSQWTNSNLLVVGYASTGTLIIDDGGAVSAPITNIGGDYASARGTLTLSATAGNRGVLTTGQIIRGVGDAELNFNGGILRASADQPDVFSGFASGEVEIDAGGAFIDSNGHDIGIWTDLTGAGGLTKLGAGTLELSGINTYAGGTSVKDGILVTWSDASLGDASGSLTLDGGTFKFGLPFNLAATRAIVLDSGGGTFDTNGFNSTIRQNIIGSGGLTKSGAGALTLTGTNTYTAETLVTGGTALAPSRLVVAGVNARIASPAANLTIGRFSGDNAALTIESGAVSTNSGVIGGASGSSGTALVRGAGSQWTNNSSLFVGESGTGSLTIENGGTVNAANGWISNSMGSSSTATVRGAGSQWNNSNYLSVGHFGTGSLMIEDGGTVSSTVGMIGAFSGSSGAVTVRGAGSQWTINNDFSVGSSGTGSLTIEDGGRVRDTFSMIGNGSGSSGAAVVRGAGSTWNNSGDLTVGRLGTGALTIEDGGAVSAATTRLGHDASGQGSLTLAGSAGAHGLLTTGQILKGAGSATLTLDGGMLQATTDQADFLSNFAPGEVVVNAGGALIDSNGHSIGIAAALSGSGGLIKTGAGLLNLTGTSTLSGPSSVLAGQLAVNGSLASSAVTVGPGAILSGTGTIGGVSALAGATIAPGNSIGTLNVAGNVGFAAGSTYAVEINAAGQADRLAATGTATLAGGTVQVLPDQGAGYVADVPYTIVTATGGVTGAFSGTTGGEFAFVTPTLGYRNDAVTLTLVRKTVPPTPQPPTPVAFHSVAVTRNQYNTADGVEALGAGSRLYDSVLGASVSGARQAFTALSGEAHASAVTVAYEDDRLVREAILTHLRQPGRTILPAFAQGSYSAAYAADLPGAPQQPVAVVPSVDPRRFALWGEGFGSWGKVRANGNAAGLDSSTGGFLLGADAQLDPAVRLGVAGGFTRTSFDIDGRLSSGSNESVFGALYGSGSWGAINLRLGASYAAHDIDVSRTVIFPGFGDAADASYDGSTLQAFGELGYGVSLGSALIEPFVGASVLRLHTDSFQESGGAAALTGYGRTYELGTTTVGVRAEARLSEAVPLTLRGLLGWRRAYGDVEPAALLAFAGGASAFVVSGVPVDRDALAVEAGLDCQASDAISLGVAYSGQIGSHAQDHALKGNFIWRFDTR